jgi:ABC-type dipeptide/oligopeptide/nickel transport system ATPase subunit
MVFQDPNASFDPRQSVRSGLRELRRLHKQRTDWTSDEDLLRRVGLQPTLLGRLPHQLSGGQAQRVSVARALLLRPKLLIADEPTSALDVSVQAQILDLLRTLCRDEDLSILFISHDLAVVRSLCRRVYVMRGGQVVESGLTADIMARPQHEYTVKLLEAIPGNFGDQDLLSRTISPS